ncbi:hypothetical protein CDAR_289041 [Caerostris darwini]|uniref:Uncharacterized protein n=1 Tax=Caerostris darwini TaxID=1538125 RepID=A0AAV4PFL4_9ARAC|nr:hypothetical protein CDAR_289041 [Caerostris darwini]
MQRRCRRQLLFGRSARTYKSDSVAEAFHGKAPTMVRAKPRWIEPAKLGAVTQLPRTKARRALFSEPTLIPKLRIELVDLPYLHCLSTCCG